jgi:anti-sigma-K factor RskA
VNETHFIDEIPAYALGALDSEERQLVEEHLKSCAVCRAEALAYQKVLEGLPMTAPLRNPPPDLRAKILAKTARPLNRQAQPAARPDQPNRQPISARGAFWQRLSSPVWPVIALLLLIALVVSNLALLNRVNQLQASQTNIQLAALTGTDNAPDADGVLVYNPNWQNGVLIVANLPRLSDNEDYQLWLIEDGQRTSGGVFSVYGSGYGYLQVENPEPITQYASFGITIEPAGGSPGPTGERVMEGSF